MQSIISATQIEQTATSIQPQSRIALELFEGIPQPHSGKRGVARTWGSSGIG